MVSLPAFFTTTSSNNFCYYYCLAIKNSNNKQSRKKLAENKNKTCTLATSHCRDNNLQLSVSEVNCGPEILKYNQAFPSFFFTKIESARDGKNQFNYRQIR